MKKLKLVLMLSFLVGTVFLLQSHSAGRAAGNNRDNTGAPGGQMGGNGSPITCINCHNNGAFAADEIGFELLDAENNLVSQYTPGEIYTAKITIAENSTTTANGYGFQMVSLFSADDSDVDGWIEAGTSDNAQISFAESTGRMYAEQDGISSSNELTAQWQAPPTNSGELIFYISGVSANGNGASSGDNSPIPIQVSFSENSTTSTFANENQINTNIYPNPTNNILNISCETKNTQIELYQFGTKLLHWNAEGNDISVSTRDLDPGLYLIVFRDKSNKILSIKKLIKI